MADFWNFSTSVRNPERLPDFLKVAAKLEGKIWNDESQEKFQILLIQYRLYLDSDNTQSLNKLSEEQKSWLIDKTHEMTFDEAQSIYRAKDYVGGGAMRGRQSMNPLKKLGYIVAEKNEIIRVTDIGRKLLDGEIRFDEAILESLLKYQLPNEITEGCSDWNSKPFISTLRLIKKVDELCSERNMKIKGVSLDEFGIFVLSMNDYNSVDETAEKILEYRADYENIKQSDFEKYRDYKKAKDEYKNNYIKQYLVEFNNPIKNAKEYSDSMKRYLRQTKYIRFLGAYGNQYIDLVPRRMLEINSILEHDTGESRNFTKQEWLQYIGTQNSYELPFETVDKLTEILNGIIYENRRLENKLSLNYKEFNIPEVKQEIKNVISEAREYRTLLQNKELKFDYNQDISKIDTVIEMLSYIASNKADKLINKPSVELEKWVNIALNIINDAISIKPNSPVGDDNEPTYTAPAGVPDIECCYENFSMICEVTTLKGRNQWYNEGQPVMRHLRDFEARYPSEFSYCIFIAPDLHEDTLETYWTSVKYGYKGATQKIVPLTIKQLSEILGIIKRIKLSGNDVTHQQMKDLYDHCVNIEELDNSSLWVPYINEQIHIWESSLL